MVYYSALHYAAKAEKSAARAEAAASQASTDIEITDLGTIATIFTPEVDKVYKASVAEALSINIGGVTGIKQGVVNQIKMYLKMLGDYSIDWGTATFYNGVTPDVVSGGTYEVFYEYNPNESTWVVGVLSAEAV